MGNKSGDDFWRICRVVSTKRRLCLLWLLFESGELSVRELADRAAIQEAVASMQLKILFSSGLIRFRRQKMRVIYRAEADSSDERVVVLLDALKRSCEKNVSFVSVIKQVTAFTHERRIEIARLLAEAPCGFADLMDRSGMTSSALSRGLFKLQKRRIVSREGKIYCLLEPSEALTRSLLDVVCRKEKT